MSEGSRMDRRTPFEQAQAVRRVLADFPIEDYTYRMERLKDASLRELAQTVKLVYDELVAFLDTLSAESEAFKSEVAEKSFFHVMTVYTTMMKAIYDKMPKCETAEMSTQTDFTQNLEIQKVTSEISTQTDFMQNLEIQTTDAALEEKAIEMPLSPPDSLPEDKKKKQKSQEPVIKAGMRKRTSSSTSNDYQKKKRNTTAETTVKSTEVTKKPSKSELDKPENDPKTPAASGPKKRGRTVTGTRYVEMKEKTTSQVPSTSSSSKTSSNISSASTRPRGRTVTAAKRNTTDALLAIKKLSDTFFIHRQAEELFVYGQAKAKNTGADDIRSVKFTRSAARRSLEEQKAQLALDKVEVQKNNEKLPLNKVEVQKNNEKGSTKGKVDKKSDNDDSDKDELDVEVVGSSKKGINGKRQGSLKTKIHGDHGDSEKDKLGGSSDSDEPKDDSDDDEYKPNKKAKKAKKSKMSRK